MNKWTYTFFMLLILSACTNKVKENDTSGFFPILSYVKSQARQLDTSLFRITKIETVNGRSDSTIIHRNDVKKYTADFINIPDVTDSTDGIMYHETKNFDQQMGLVFMSYITKDPDARVIKQDITILPSLGETDQVRTIYIEKIEDGGDIEKKMLWDVGRHFNIRTITHHENAADEVHDLKIVWQDFSK